MPINEEKCQRKIQETTEAKKPEKRPRNGDRKAAEKWTKVQGRQRPWPKVASPLVAGDHGCMVAGDHGCMVAGDPGNPGRQISAETSVCPILFAFRDDWPL
ncbi:hypothetical protein MRB53_023518 [Persea americana]|uniref:Uncharacterized protein n=1 Tax=Persea americana TaxID=3435 RepID=A0ACC2L9T5_PERAE|nr:hypothetical protein MRB53_023518 [Persea americana]